MIEYGTFVNGQLIKHKEYQQGDKPLTYTEKPEEPEGKVAIFHWEESTDAIVQAWELIDGDSGTIDEPTDADKAEAFDILIGGAS